MHLRSKILLPLLVSVITSCGGSSSSSVPNPTPTPSPSPTTEPTSAPTATPTPVPTPQSDLYHYLFESAATVDQWQYQRWGGTVDVDISHDNSGAIALSPQWNNADDDKFVIFTNLGGLFDLENASISLDIYIPQAYVDDGTLAFQPFVRDSESYYATIQWEQSQYQTGDGWTTFSYTNIDTIPDNNNPLGWIEEGFRISEVAQIGVEIMSRGKPTSVGGTILIDNIVITPQTPAVTPTPTPPPAPTPTPTVLEADQTPDPALPMPSDDNYQAAATAARFLNQATFGATAKSINTAMSISREEWIDTQITMPQTLQLPILDARVAAIGMEPIRTEELDTEAWQRDLQRSDIWWETAIWGKDQLRQKVAYALSQIFVVSNVSDVLFNDSRGIANYHDMLARHALGNFRTLLSEVTLSPIMGEYLSMIRNEKADPERNIRPDENYARELMQLFTIGLVELELDGSTKLSETDQPIPTYGQDDIKALARVFTGWNHGTVNNWYEWANDGISETLPMKAFRRYHDMDAKTLFGDQTIPAGLTAEEDIEAALDILFNHPNVGPFISKQLIQRLVTSNPSAAYVERVASTFNNNGSDVRGDMVAVVKAILLDDEAINGHISEPTTFGKLREPIMKVAGVWRAFKAQGAPVKHNNGLIINRLRMRATDRELGQRPFGSFSVFNFYRPDYQQPGEIKNADLYSPEFQIMTESQIVSSTNRLSNNVFWRDTEEDWPKSEEVGQDWDSYPSQLYLAEEKSLAGDRAALLDRINLLLLGGQMSAVTYNNILAYMDSQSVEGWLWRPMIYDTLFLVSISPDYAVQQ
ncbi:DUF1800 domain-containing protein [Teredinibacter waterburyi]|uniref:DUF1800 domain-containing protein n=1 Tax=Teredinibacter waterburyi TaxID=1500538 RepID=UPI001FEBB772|nr:DUF1800 domain-containing protein [Teredinibacter waterburyi]